ncbi:sporulation protein YunB [Candidatus Clostridium radicumherbarum]|uniref:Sporulation protein YunB n=1 Tax=Candidatus Clostridium radicumherbarum TaxID=3381662 RepID=A0ABW8TVX4_9CLOT
MKRKTKIKLILSFIAVITIFNLFIYIVDKAISPAIIAVANAEIRSKSMEIIYTSIINEYSKQFNYNDIIHVEKDGEGNITLLKADTLKLNKIACDVALDSQKQLKLLGNTGVKLPLGYILQNNLLAKFGPKITVFMNPIGYIETKYESEFESAGINQTRHKIYVKVQAKLRVVIPLKKEDIDVVSEVPISETIIVGKIPNTSINMGLDGAGFKLNSR